MDNLRRMITLAEDFFGMRNDPAQISVDERTTQKLQKIHPATLSEERTAGGPVAWILVIPTTREVMDEFLTKRITERELLERTPISASYDALYLCSALVLPEYRGKGLARRLAASAIRSILKDHPLRDLFYWGFSQEGRKLASALAVEFGLPLHVRAP